MSEFTIEKTTPPIARPLLLVVSFPPGFVCTRGVWPEIDAVTDENGCLKDNITDEERKKALSVFG